ncbi:MAG: hypothetical protein NTZ93_02725 [Candidatus Beckwithbacteria bacterium]|nr:hypothetical protein [Candidatus Beckwithbacteria bacterium]
MLIFLLLFALATRLPHIWGYNIPFSYDHGRDALAVLDLIKNFSLKFIGPWTSIQGVFFGPGWYYLLAPLYWLLNGNPLAGPLTMQIIGLVIIWLAYKQFGIYEAVIFASAPIFTMISVSAANPFPMALIGLLILICLKTPSRHPISLGLLVGLGFHFSSALAIFYLLIIPLILLFRKIKLNLIKLMIGLIIPFIPQILFEIKYNFLEVRSLISYFAAGESQHINPGKIEIVTKSVFHELSLAVLPDGSWLKYLALGLLITGIVYLIAKRKINTFWPDIVLFILIPTIGFWWLHYNVWYVYGLLPVAVVAIGRILHSVPKIITYSYLGLLIIGGVKIPVRQIGNGFLPIKLQVLNYIYDQAQGKLFSSYQYLPNIYDYPYQYLYFWQAFKGKPLPVEFAYKPGEISYVSEKPKLLKLFPKNNQPPDIIFLIIERPENIWHYPFQSWLNNIKYSEIISKKEFGPELEVWQVKP